MVSFEEAGRILDEVYDSLPDIIFESLNGGVNLLPASRTDTNGLLVMGTYCHDQTGRRVEIYYGSFCSAFPDADPEECRSELSKVLKHELRHHIESLAGDRSLEKWDEQHVMELLDELYGLPKDAKSVLFVDDDDSGLAACAAASFRLMSKDLLPGMRCASAGAAEPAALTDPKIAEAAAACGLDISAHVPKKVTSELIEGHDIVLCMTESQGDGLAAVFPSADYKIICLGAKDIYPPVLGTRSAWKRTVRLISADVDYLIYELREGEADAPSQ